MADQDLLIQALEGANVGDMVEVLKSLPPEELQRAAEASRLAGNDLFKKGEYADAIKMYNQALVVSSEDARVFCNRAACHLALGDNMQALQDAAQSTRLDPKGPKGFYRLGCALVNLGQHKEAFAVFQKGLALNPNNADMRRKAAEANAKVTEAAQIEAMMPALNGEDPAAAQKKKRKNDAPEVDVDLYRPEFSNDRIAVVGNAYRKLGKLASNDSRGLGMARLIEMTSQVSSPRRHMRQWSPLVRLPVYAEALRAVVARAVAAAGATRPLALHVGVGLGVAPVVAALEGMDVATMDTNRFLLTCLMGGARASNVKEGSLRPILCPGERLTDEHLRHAFATAAVKTGDSSKDSPEDDGTAGARPEMELAPHRKAALIIAELFDPGLLACRLLPTVHHLRSLCAAGAPVFPFKITVSAALVCLKSGGAFAERHAIDLAPVDRAYRWSPHYQSVQMSRERYVAATEAVEVFSFDLRDAATLQPAKAALAMPVTTECPTVNGVMFWMTLHLDEDDPDATVSFAPWDHPALSQAVQYLDAFCDLPSVGGTVTLTAHHNTTRIWFDNPAGCKKVAHKNACPAWHLHMLSDDRRNEAYEKALTAAIKRQLATRGNGAGCTVVDMGSGTGMLPVVARKAGATRVVCCEPSDHMRRVAAEVLAANGLEGSTSVDLVGSDVRRLKLRTDSVRVADLQAGEESTCTTAARGHVLVAELLDYGALGEGIIPLVKHAKAVLMREQCSIIPCRVVLHAQLISHTQGTVAGVDLTAWDKMLWTMEYSGIDVADPSSAGTVTVLSDVVDMFSFDFTDVDTLSPDEKELDFPIVKEGVVNGVIFFFTMWLDDETVITSAPRTTAAESPSHWMQAVQYYEPHRVASGDTFRLSVKHTGTDVMFAVVPGQEGKRTGGEWLDANWLQMHQGLSKQLGTLHQGLGQDLNERAVAGSKALTLATHPGLFGLDPEDTQNFALTFCS